MLHRILIIVFISTLLIPDGAILHAQGVDMGQGYCSLHGNYRGASCPACAKTASSINSSESDFRLQLVRSAIPLIMDLFKKDPRKQQQLLESQQKALRDIAIENQRQKQIKDALEQALHDKLMALYKPLPGSQRLEMKTMPGNNNALSMKTFDGDKGDYMYKGVEVNTPAFGIGLSAQEIQVLLDPENDPVVADLRNANDFIVKNLKSESAQANNKITQETRSNGTPIIQQTDCAELKNKLAGFVKEREDFQKTIVLTQTELADWKEKNNKALWNAAESGIGFLSGKFFEHMEESRKNASNIKKWLMDFEKPMRAKGIDVDGYIKLLDVKVINYNISGFADRFSKTTESVLAVRDASQSLAGHFAKTDAEIAAILENPNVKLFLTDGEAKFEANTLGISQATADNLNKGLALVTLAGKFLAIVNPVASATQFAIDEVYNAADWILSYKLILQQNNVHDKETEAAEYIQTKINTAFELLKNCK